MQNLSGAVRERLADPVDDLLLALSMARSLDEILLEVRLHLRALIGADGVTFVLRDGDHCYYAEEDAIAPLWKGKRFPIDACISGWAMLNRQPVVIEDIYADERIPHAAYRPTFVKSLLMMPVQIEEPVAAIGVYWARRHLATDQEVNVLRRLANSASVALMNVALMQEMTAARQESERAKDAVIFAMALLAEVRDNETGNHINRTQHYMRVLAEAARDVYPAELNDDTINTLFKSAPLHDIGKIGIPDSILLKPGLLTDAEREVMKTHAEKGRHAIEAAEERLGASAFLTVAKDIAYTHHERWDGSGYPRGIAGTDIPLAGRLMAIADVYDALVSRRVYKQAMPHQDAMAIITAERGRQFDPQLVDAFLTVAEDFGAIHRRFEDKQAEPQIGQ